MKSHRQHAFTLVELLITITIGTILIAVALPSFSSLLGNNAQTTAINQFVRYLHFARGEAIKRNNTVIICPSADQQTCLNNANWENGWLVFATGDSNTSFDPNIDELIHVQSDAYTDMTIRSPQSRRRISFQSTGMSPGSNATYTFCSTQTGISAKAVILSNTGRPRVSDEGASGQSLSCQ